MDEFVGKLVARSAGETMHKRKTGVRLRLLLITGFMLVAASPAAARFQTISRFCDDTRCGNVDAPNTNLVMDSAGDLYGTTQDGGLESGGTVFELIPETRVGSDVRHWKLKVLYYFCARNGCIDGKNPSGTLIADAAGNLYGTTSSGGAVNNNGAVFELSPIPGNANWKEKVLYSFCSKDSACTDGSAPAAGLSYTGQTSGAPYDGLSNLYGTAFGGGKFFSGTAFVLKQVNGTWHETPIYAFCSQGGSQCTDGSGPNSRLLVGSTGTLYGTTQIGGCPHCYSNMAGIVFKLSSVSGSTKWSLDVLHTFCIQEYCADGAVPSPLVIDAAGNLYGTAGAGGSGAHCPSPNSCGLIFKIAPNGTESDIYDFCANLNCSDGEQPTGGLTIDSSGDLLGTTALGGSGANCINYCGTLFKFSKTSLHILHAFCSKPNCDDGGDPTSGVILDSEGSLFGTTEIGSETTGASTVFEWEPKTP